MSRVLLDTDIFSEILKQRDAVVAARTAACRKAESASRSRAIEENVKVKPATVTPVCPQP
jgi:hypothetical protein